MLIQDGLKFFREIVIVFDQHGNFQHEFETCGYRTCSCIAVSDDSKVFVAARVGKKVKRDCVLVYNFNGVLLNSIGNGLLRSVKDMTFIDLEGGRIVVLSCGIFIGFHVYQFSEQGNFLSWYNVSFKGSGQIRLLHKTERIVELDFSHENLFLYNKDGTVVRKIKLNLPAFKELDGNDAKFAVTTQGLVVMLTTEKGTGKRMIAIP